MIKRFLTILICWVMIIESISSQTKHYYHLEGEIGQRSASMEMIRSTPSANNPDDSYFAHFYLEDDGLPITGYMNTYNEKQLEFLFYDRIADIERRMIGIFTNDKYAGIFVDNKDTFPFSFQIVPAPLPVRQFLNERLVQDTSPVIIKSSLRYNFFLPCKDPAAADYILQQYIDPGFTTANFQQETRHAIQSYLGERTALIALQKEAFAIGESVSFFNEELSFVFHPAVNTKELLVMQFNRYYLGEAMFADIYTHYHNYLPALKKWIHLEEIIDSSQFLVLEKIINQAIKYRHGIAETTTLEKGNPDLFIAQSADISYNFILTKQGLVFVYNGGQISNRFYGDYKILVPFSQLQTILRSDFTWK